MVACVVWVVDVDETLPIKRMVPVAMLTQETKFDFYFHDNIEGCVRLLDLLLLLVAVLHLALVGLPIFDHHHWNSPIGLSVRIH